MYMRNRPEADSFPMGYSGIHDRPNMLAQEEKALASFNSPQALKEEEACPVPAGNEKGGFLGRLFGGGSGHGEKGLIAGLELDDLILIGLMLLIFMDGGDSDLLLVLAFLFFSGFDGFGLGGLGLGGLL